LEEVRAAEADVVVGPLAAVVAACFGWGFVSWIFLRSTCWDGQSTSAAKCKRNEEPGAIRYNVSNVYQCGDCKEYAKDPACRSAWVVNVEVEVSLAAFSS
jgi:hypothetical protein